MAPLTVGCGPSGKTNGNPSNSAHPTARVVDIASAADSDLEREYAAASEACMTSEADVVERCVFAASVASELHTRLSLRSPRPLGSDTELVRSGRELLRKASQRSDRPGACDAALELARFEAAVRVDLEAAYTELYRTEARYKARSELRACVEEARRMLGLIESYAPARRVLVAIDLDPFSGDPTHGSSPAPQPLTSSEALAAGWDFRPSYDGERASIRDVQVIRSNMRDRDNGTSRFVLLLDRPAPMRIVQNGEACGVELAHATMSAHVIEQLATFDTQERDARLGRPVALEARASMLDEEHLRFSVVHRNRGGAGGQASACRAFVLRAPYRVVIDRVVSSPAARTGRLVVIDAGHGGTDAGARANGLREATLTLDVALRTERVLKRMVPGIEVALTRENDVPVTLEHRAFVANALAADLFVSIHFNAEHSDSVESGGVATFVLNTSTDVASRRLAALENGTEEGEVTSMETLMASFVRERQTERSRLLAGHVHRQLLTAGRKVYPALGDRGLKSALFYVLVGATMPAILVEPSFVTSVQDSQHLKEERYREAIADGIARGIGAYFSDRDLLTTDGRSGRQ